jgi:hypothetical protein
MDTCNAGALPRLRCGLTTISTLIERDKKSQKALNRKLPEFAAQHLGNLGLFDSEKTGGFNRFHTSSAFGNPRSLNTLLLIGVIPFFPLAMVAAL